MLGFCLISYSVTHFVVLVWLQLCSLFNSERTKHRLYLLLTFDSVCSAPLPAILEDLTLGLVVDCHADIPEYGVFLNGSVRCSDKHPECRPSQIGMYSQNVYKTKATPYAHFWSRS